MKPQLTSGLLVFLLAASLHAQDINNTLGTSGTFTIKDGATTFLSLTQSDGNVSLNNILTLPVATSSSIGVIYKGADRFMHDYKPFSSSGNNTFVGVNSGNFTMSGSSFYASNNTGAGRNTLTSLTSGYYNSAVGVSALYSNTTGATNSAFGWWALYSNTGGNGNAAVGGQTLYSNTTGELNSALGGEALYSNTTGGSNSAVGYYAIYNNTTGWGSSGFGSYALYLSTGSHNTALGDSAGYNITTGSNNTLLGYNAQPSVATISNEITLGDGNVSALRCNATLSSLSDARDKRNIEDLSLGLDFLMNVKPRLFNWDRRDWYEDGRPDGSKMKEEPTAGFIAQELDQAQTEADAEWLSLVLKSNPDRLEATPGNLLPIMVKAIQELKAENDGLRNEIKTLRRTIAAEVKTLLQNERLDKNEVSVNGLED